MCRRIDDERVTTAGCRDFSLATTSAGLLPRKGKCDTSLEKREGGGSTVYKMLWAFLNTQKGLLSADSSVT